MPYILACIIFAGSAQSTVGTQNETDQLTRPLIVSRHQPAIRASKGTVQAALVPDAVGSVARSRIPPDAVTTASLSLPKAAIPAPAVLDAGSARPRLLDAGLIFPVVNRGRKTDRLVPRVPSVADLKARAGNAYQVAFAPAAQMAPDDMASFLLRDKSAEKVPSLDTRKLDNPRDALQCLAKAVYFEARGEPETGQIAVAQVVMNRVKHWFYPNDICGVVFQNQNWLNKCQFSFACDGQSDRPRSKIAWLRALKLASKVLDGDVYLKGVGEATHYHADYVRPRWIRDMRQLERIGRHIFYSVRSWS